MRKDKKIQKEKAHSTTHQSVKQKISKSKSITPPNPVPYLSQQNRKSSYKDSYNRKWECNSHFFELNPLPGMKTHFSKTFCKFAHEGSFYPCPTVLL